MAFLAIAARQVKAETKSSPQANTITITPASAVAAGSSLVLVGGAKDTNTGQTVLLSSVADTSTNTWGSPTNVRLSSSYNPNAFLAIAENVAAGTPTITATFNRDGYNSVTWALFEIEKVVTSSGADKTVTGTATGTTGTISTTATGALTQTDNLVILVASGYSTTWDNPAGYTIAINNAHTSAAIGTLIGYKNVAATDSITGTVTYASASAETSAILVVLKAASGSVLQYKFELNPAEFTDADTGITGYVWRNGNPDEVLAEKYTSLEGDATDGDLIITGVPSGAALGDTIIGSFYNATDGSRPFVAGAVEEV